MEKIVAYTDESMKEEISSIVIPYGFRTRRLFYALKADDLLENGYLPNFQDGRIFSLNDINVAIANFPKSLMSLRDERQFLQSIIDRGNEAYILFIP